MSCFLSACNKTEEFSPEDAEVSGTIIKSFNDKKKDTMVPAAVFPYDDSNFVLMNILGLPPSKVFITKDFSSYNELYTKDDGQALYQYADSFGDYIIWSEIVYKDSGCHNYFVFSKKTEEVKCIYSFRKDAYVDKRYAFCGGYNGHFYCLRKNMADNKVEVVDYNIESEQETVLNDFDYSQERNYSLKVKANLLILLATDDNDQRIVRVINLDDNSIKDTKIPDDISAPIYVDYDPNRDMFAFISNSTDQQSIFLYDVNQNEAKSLIDYSDNFENDGRKLDIRNGKVMWIQKKNADGGVLCYYGIMLYDIDTGKLEKIEKAFNYNFISNNEFYYYTYLKNTDLYKVDMYKYNFNTD